MASDSDDSRDDDPLPSPSSSSEPSWTTGLNKNIAWSKLPPGVKPDVELDELNRPVGHSGLQYTRYLGTLARDTSLCPLHYTGWHRVPKEKKDLIWSRVQERCTIPNDLREWSIAEVGDRWKAYKHRLKRDHYNISLSAADLMAKKPREIPLDQWQSLIDYWESDLSKERTNKAKAARSKLTTKHTMGSIGYAAHKHKIMKKTGKAPTKIELWKHCHTKKDGTPVDPESARIMAKMDALSQPSDPSQTSMPSVTSHNEVFSRVMGPEHPGRLRCMGKGITKTMVRGSCSKATSSVNDKQVRQLIREEMSNVEDRIDQRMEQQFTSQQTMFQQRMEQQFASQQTIFQQQMEQQFASQRTMFQERMEQQFGSQRTMFQERMEQQFASQQTMFQQRMEQQFTSQQTLFQQQFTSQQMMFQEQIEAKFERLIAVFQGSVPRSEALDADTSNSRARRNPPAPPRRHRK